MANKLLFIIIILCDEVVSMKGIWHMLFFRDIAEMAQ